MRAEGIAEGRLSRTGIGLHRCLRVLVEVSRATVGCVNVEEVCGVMCKEISGKPWVNVNCWNAAVNWRQVGGFVIGRSATLGHTSGMHYTRHEGHISPLLLQYINHVVRFVARHDLIVSCQWAQLSELLQICCLHSQ